MVPSSSTVEVWVSVVTASGIDWIDLVKVTRPRSADVPPARSKTGQVTVFPATTPPSLAETTEVKSGIVVPTSIPVRVKLLALVAVSVIV